MFDRMNGQETYTTVPLGEKVYKVGGVLVRHPLTTPESIYSRVVQTYAIATVDFAYDGPSSTTAVLASLVFKHYGVSDV